MNSDFSNAKVGMKAWSIQLGNCQILNVATKHVKVTNMKKSEIYRKDGKMRNADMYPSLFHEKPKCFKTKVKKTVELKGYYYPDGNVFHFSDTILEKKHPAKATITYEVEE